MPDFLEYLRQKNIFGAPPIYGNDLPSQGGFTGRMPIPGRFPDDIFTPKTLPQPINEPSWGMPLPQPINAPSGAMPLGDEIPYDVNARMRELYQPTSDAQQRLEQLINQYPAEAKKPGWLKVIGATLADMARPGTGMSVIEGNRAGRVADWKNKVGPVEQAANIERYENVNSRTLAYQQVSAELRQQAQDAREKNDERKALIAEHRASLYDFKTRNPLLKLIIPKGGNVQAFNPLTGETKDTGIPTGSLTETDKINMQQENRLEQIGATGEEARRTEGVRQTGRESIEETRNWQIYNIPDPDKPGQQKAVKINAGTGEVRDITSGPARSPLAGVSKPSAAGGKPETAANKKARQYLLARELYNRNPTLRKFIHLDKTGPGTFELDVPGVSRMWGSSGPTQDEYNELQNFIYGDTPSIQLGGGVTGGGGGNKPRILSITPVK